MYKKPTQPTPNINNTKKTNRGVGQPTQLDKKNETHSSQFKNKDEQLLGMVKEYLNLMGYTRSYEILKNQKPTIKVRTNLAPMHSRTDINKNQILILFERGNRQQFFKNTHKLFINSDDLAKRLEFELNIYFCIFNIHPCLKKQPAIDKASSEAFKKYLDTKGAELSNTNEFICYFALAFMPKPQQNAALSHLFTKQWITTVKNKLIQTINNYLKHPISQNQSQPVKKISALQEMFHNMIDQNSSVVKEEHKQNFNHSIEITALRQENSELRMVIEGLQKKFTEFVESSKAQLIESGQKWFNFSSQIYMLAKKQLKEGKKNLLDKYDTFFMGNMDEHIEANQISLFDKNSYMNEDLSVTPDMSKRISAYIQREL